MAKTIQRGVMIRQSDGVVIRAGNYDLTGDPDFNPAIHSVIFSNQPLCYAPDNVTLCCKWDGTAFVHH